MKNELLNSENQKKQPKPLTKEHLEEIRRQPRVRKEQFIEELFSCIEDCFEGTVKQECGGISISLPAGERFLIAITEN